MHNTTTVPGSPPAGHLISVWTLLTELGRAPLLTLLLPLLVAGAAGAFAHSAQRQYAASASILPGGAKRQSSQFGQLASQLGIAIGSNSEESPALYGELLRSRDVLKGALLAKRDTSPTAATIESVWFHGPDHRSDNLSELRDRTSVTMDAITGILGMQVVMVDSVAAETVARALLTSLTAFNLQRRRASTGTERQFVEEQLRAARDSLRSAQDKQADFARTNRAYTRSPDLEIEAQRLQREVEMRQELYSSLAVQLASLRIEEARATPQFTIIEAPEGNVFARSRRVIVKAGLAWFASTVIIWSFVFARRALETQRSRADYQGFLRTIGLRRAT